MAASYTRHAAEAKPLPELLYIVEVNTPKGVEQCAQTGSLYEADVIAFDMCLISGVTVDIMLGDDVIRSYAPPTPRGFGVIRSIEPDGSQLVDVTGGCAGWKHLRLVEFGVAQEAQVGDEITLEYQSCATVGAWIGKVVQK